VAVVNASQNLEKMRRVNADMVFSPQLLGAELLSRTLLGEKFDSSIFYELSFAKPIASEPVGAFGEPMVEQTLQTQPSASTTTSTSTSTTTNKS
jgi:Trk K+ transport system NAD-binding subunit